MIVVTGASGLIGEFVVRELIGSGHQVKAISRRNFSKKNTTVLTWLQGDITDPVFLREAFAGASHVFHCAGLVSYAPQDKDLLQKINVEGTANVVDACLEAASIKLCYVSSIAAVENAKNSTQSDEKVMWDLGAEHSLYAESKYYGELEVWRGIEEGLDAVIVNPSIVLGPGNWEESSTKLFRYVFNQNKFYTAGSANFVDVRDVADAMLRLAFSDITAERFILNGSQLAYKEFFKAVAACFGKKEPTIAVNSKMAGILWRIEYLRGLITGKRPLITKDTARIAGKSHFYQNAKIKQTLNFEFRPITDTVSWCCTQLQQKNNTLVA